jgi:hypothetical protein
MFFSSSSPKRMYSDWIAEVSSWPWDRAIRDWTGSPGMSLGRKKLMVIAAHAVNA